MADTELHVGVRAVAGLADDAVDAFLRSVESDELRLEFDQADDVGVYASALEWLMPTAIVAYVAKPYFEGFLAAAGEDHYRSLKASLAKLASEVAGPGGPRLRLVGSRGKVPTDDPTFSLAFSVYAGIESGLRFKLLIPNGIGAESIEQIVGLFLDTIRTLHDGSYVEGSIAGLDGVNPVYGTIAVVYSAEHELFFVHDAHRRGNDAAT